MQFSIEQTIFWVIFSIGLAIVIKPIYQILNSLYYHFKPMPNFIRIYGEGSWAVITGATDGIGYGFCQQLALLGFNICLISRNRQKLEQKIKQLQKQVNNKVMYKYIVADFTKSSDPKFFQPIKNKLDQLDIGMLINNVGISNIQYLTQQKQEIIYNIINVNCYAMAILTKYIANKMKKRQSKKKGGIINISSYSWVNPMPFMTVYAATKGYNNVFSHSFSRQCREANFKIDVLSVKAMKVISGAVHQEKSLTVPTSRECAHDCLKYLGNSDITAGHIKHQLMAHITDFIPQWLFTFIALKQARKVYVDFNQNNKKQK